MSLLSELTAIAKKMSLSVETGVFSGTAACLLGIVQIFTGTLNASWLDTEMFSNIGTRIVSGFDNPNVFAEYLLLIIPLTLACLFQKGEKHRKLFYSLSLVLMLICLVFTWSRGAWLGFLVGTLLFFMILSKKAVLGLLGLVVVSPLLSWLVPNAVAERFLSIGNLAESSVSYRISVWYGMVELLKKTWWSGIGVGNAAFEAVYPSVALVGAGTIEHAHSIYLQLLAELGIPGLLVFLLILFLFVQNCFEYLLKVKHQEERDCGSCRGGSDACHRHHRAHLVQLPNLPCILDAFGAGQFCDPTRILGC